MNTCDLNIRLNVWDVNVYIALLRFYIISIRITVGLAVSNGVTTVNILNDVSGTSDSSIRTAVVNAATASLGNLSSQFDHLMLCLPPGTSGGWIAYATSTVGWVFTTTNGAIMSAGRCMVSIMLFFRSAPFRFFHNSNPIRSLFDSYPKHRNWT